MILNSLARFLGIILCLGAFSNWLTSAQLVCPTDYLLLKDRCYSFYKNSTYEMTFDEARNYCDSSSFGSFKYDLISINDAEEYSLITAEIQVRIGDYDDLGYLPSVGAYSANGTSDWYWVDGTRLAADDDMWECHSLAPLSPDENYAAYLSINGLYLTCSVCDCYNFGSFRLRVNYHPNGGNLWWFICEGPALSDPSSQLTHLTSSEQLACPADYVLFKDRCYLFRSDRQPLLTFDDARNYCASSTIGSYTYDLLVISDYEEYTLITAELRFKATVVFIGGYRNGFEWYWVDGSPLPSDDPLWNCNEDNSSPYNVTSLYYVTTSRCYSFNTFRIRIEPSSKQHPFICEGPAMPVNILSKSK